MVVMTLLQAADGFETGVAGLEATGVALWLHVSRGDDATGVLGEAMAATAAACAEGETRAGARMVCRCVIGGRLGAGRGAAGLLVARTPPW